MSDYADDARTPTPGMDPADRMTPGAQQGMGTPTPGMEPADPRTPGAEQGMGTTGHTADEHTATTDHDVIRAWAEDRHATPATVEGTEHDGELRFDFDFGNNLEELKQITWDEWFAAFDERGLEFVFHEAARADGSVSNDFHLESGRAAGR